MAGSSHSPLMARFGASLVVFVGTLLLIGAPASGNDVFEWPADYEFERVEFDIFEAKMARPGKDVESLLSCALNYLIADSMQQELKLSAEKQQIVEQLAREYFRARGDASNRSGPRAEVRRRDILAADSAVRVDAAVERLLSDSEKDRLNQVMFQASFPLELHSALSSPVVASLGFTKEQQGAIDAILDEHMSVSSQRFHELRVGSAAPAATMQARKQEYEQGEAAALQATSDRIRALLSPEQLTRIDEKRGREVDARKLDDEIEAAILEIFESDFGGKRVQPAMGFARVKPLAAPAPPPPPAGKPSMRTVTGLGQILLLFQTELVQKEMAFTPSQQESIRRVRQERRANRKRLDPEASSAEINAFYRERETREAKSFAAIEALLTPAQKERLDEIAFQAFLPYAFYRFNSLFVAEFLGLSGAQAAQVDQIYEDYLTRPSPMYDKGDDADYAYWKEERAIEQDATNDLLALLTVEQRERLTQLAGRRIELATLQEQLWTACAEEIRATRMHLQDPRPDNWPRNLTTGEKLEWMNTSTGQFR